MTKPKDAQPRLLGGELLDEVQWFISSGVSPELTAQELGRSMESISRTAYRYGRPELGAQFQ